MTLVWPTIENFLREHGKAVLVTLSQPQGACPRDAGTHTVVRSGGRFSGILGVGAPEWLALAAAHAMGSQLLTDGVSHA
jgi:xanthine/CO dehydrogenase XdhC/CoxF family maturation factor